jgi:hypothetical protein
MRRESLTDREVKKERGQIKIGNLSNKYPGSGEKKVRSEVHGLCNEVESQVSPKAAGKSGGGAAQTCAPAQEAPGE